MNAASPSAGARVYLIVFAGLLLLTLATVGVAAAPLGGWHTPIALTIAGAKGALIYLFFMHALEAGRLARLIAAGALLWLAVMICLTLADYQTRGLDSRLRQYPKATAAPENG